MISHLWDGNAPADFWQLEEAVPPHVWNAAVAEAAPLLDLPGDVRNTSDILWMILGEGRYGIRHLGPSPANRMYYRIKPCVPDGLGLPLRRLLGSLQPRRYRLGWPHDDRYARFLWAVARGLLVRGGLTHARYRHFWPAGATFSLVLTHDVETARGQEYVRAVADLDEAYGFRSSFNLVPERYRLDDALIAELGRRGFEVGVHGLKHDGRLFDSHEEFLRRAERINHYLEELDAVGFRAPYVMRNPTWMQALNVAYDASFFDTDPYQPIPGGTLSLWPFLMGRFVELPYTLTQDCVLIYLRRERTATLWLRKMDVIARYRGMALLNAHPDYLRSPECRRVYEEFLRAMARRRDFWHALPREVAHWWRQRAAGNEIAGAMWGDLDVDETGCLHVDGVPYWTQGEEVVSRVRSRAEAERQACLPE